eukprot:CAMPEP_0118673804 /NCGR_PEP_ID=MMETSP0800-20121206/534_1 /TAXON_ID=210618 ORGANISM="Striatella unipunctata, Strain CCMP2910" /NCGR_SAMPLE_ID=MMETSP0800 /ASSEMBLY_ACC=CAM_ASM_000638 /LENGTH=257 /DNA_ID=CAMNT_0006568925 /DNA_START=69 /DNA_END=842 /DNA_ORIENTATION=-
MAAVLCKSIGDICGGTCDALGKVICLPCRLCGMSCNACCEMVSSPFFLYFAVTLGLNTPPVAYGIKATAYIVTGGGGDVSDECSSLHSWLLVNATLCAVHMIAAFYIVHMIQLITANEQMGVVVALPSAGAAVTGLEEGTTATKYQAQPENFAQQTPVVTGTAIPAGVASTTPQSTGGTRENSYGRLRHVLCYDKWVAIYILVIIFYVVWQTVGSARALGGADCGQLHRWTVRTLLCDYMFMGLGLASFAISACCMR